MVDNKGDRLPPCKAMYGIVEHGGCDLDQGAETSAVVDRFPKNRVHTSELWTHSK